MKYTRIDIKTEADLPKEEKEPYYAMTKNGNMIIAYYDLFAGNWKCGTTTVDIDWYLIEDTEPSYPEPFLYWLVFEDHLFFPQEEKGENVWYDYDCDCMRTLDEVCDFWLNEIKKVI